MNKWTSGRVRAGLLSCWRVRPLLQPYLDGVLDATAASRVSQHLAGCGHCGQDAEAYRAIKDSLRRRQLPVSDVVTRLRKFGAALFGEPDVRSHDEQQRSVKG